MVNFSEIRFIILKALSGCIPVLLLITCKRFALLVIAFGILLTKKEEGEEAKGKVENCYTLILMCNYFMYIYYLIPNRVFSLLIVLTEFSPFILENYLVHSCPWLGTNNGKGAFYIMYKLIHF